MPGMREAFGFLRSWREPDTALAARCRMLPAGGHPGGCAVAEGFFVPGEARGIPRAGLRSQAK